MAPDPYLSNEKLSTVIDQAVQVLNGLVVELQEIFHCKPLSIFALSKKKLQKRIRNFRSIQQGMFREIVAVLVLNSSFDVADSMHWLTLPDRYVYLSMTMNIYSVTKVRAADDLRRHNA